MGKIIFIMLIFALFLVSCAPPTCNKPYLLVGSACCLDKNDNGICDNDEKELPASIEETEEVSQIEEISQPEPQKIFKIGDEIIAGEFKWKITKITKQKEIGQDIAGTFFGAKADGEFLILDVDVANVGNSANILSDSFIKLVDDKGREFTADSSAAFYLEQGSALAFYDTVNPGIVKKGKVVFDVPTGLKVVNVMISDNLVEDLFYTVKLIT